MKKYTLKNKDIQLTKEEVEELAQKLEDNDMPEEGEEYWCVDFTSLVTSYVWRGDDVDLYLYKSGNYFKTREEAEEYAKYKQALAEVRHAIVKRNDGWMLDHSNLDEQNYTLFFDYDKGCWRPFVQYANLGVGLPYAKNKDILQEVIEEKSEELEVIKNYMLEHNV